METPEVAEFRRCILTASWDSAETALMRLGVAEGEGLWVSLVNLDSVVVSSDMQGVGGEVPHCETEVPGTP